MKSLYPWFALAALMASLSPAPSRAQTVGAPADTRLRLDEGLDRQNRQAEKRLLDDADDLSGAPPTLEIDGQTYSVANTVNELGPALYVTVVRRMWPEARRFLKAYRALPDADPMLVLYADGSLARQDGDLFAAERHFRELAEGHPDFLPGRLELARTLFENRKDREAGAEFRGARALLGNEGDKAGGVLHNVDSFLAALRKRRGWQGSIAIGPGYSSNVNQSSGSYACLFATDEGICLFDRKVPDPIGAAGVNFEATVARRLPLAGNNGIAMRALAYGDIYPGQGSYSQTTLTTQFGYDRRTGRSSLTLAPTFDFATYGPRSLYDAWGGRGEYMLNLSATAAVKVEASRKQFHYRQPAYRDHDGALTEGYLTIFYALPHQWTLFGGPDIADKGADDPVNAFRQYGARFGITKALGRGASAMLFASVRHRDYRAYSELLEAHRRDWEQNYILALKGPVIGKTRLSPSLLVQHNRVNSTVDWLYTTQRTTASLRLDYAF